MSYAWEQHDEADVDATVEEVWQAISTGPGLDSWFMGRSEVGGGAVRTDLGGYVMESTITGEEPLRRFAFRTGEPDARFVAFEYLIEGRDQGGTVLRVVTNGFFPGDDWEAEFEAMTKGGAMYFATLVAYLNHFAGRVGTPVTAMGPPVSDWGAAWTKLRAAVGVTESPAIGDRVKLAPTGLPATEGVVDFVNDQALGIRTPDALYRFVQGFFGSMVIGHHLFGADAEAETSTWQGFLTDLYA